MSGEGEPLADRPELTNSGLTDPAPYATAVTPFGITATATDGCATSALFAIGSLTSSAVIVAEAIEEAAQAIVQPDVPLALVDDLVAALQGPAVADALKARVKLIVDGGTADEDDFLPIGWLPMEARQAFAAARDRLNDDHRDLALVRAKLVEGVAFGLAAIDRLDRAARG